VCASDGIIASNCDGARYTPRSSMCGVEPRVAVGVASQPPGEVGHGPSAEEPRSASRPPGSPSPRPLQPGRERRGVASSRS
jgi:hypothetical protein